MYLLLDPGVFVMERKMLVEIKKRAEARRAVPPTFSTNHPRGSGHQPPAITA
jgi:hypothetical protein